MVMYPTITRAGNYWHELGNMPDTFLDNIPTFDKRLDSFFDKHAESIIEEWGLLTDNDLRDFKRKLDFLSYEVNRLVVEKSTLERRTRDLRSMIEELEKK